VGTAARLIRLFLALAPHRLAQRVLRFEFKVLLSPRSWLTAIRHVCQLRGPGNTTPPKRNIIAQAALARPEPLKSLGLIQSAKISPSLNSGKIRLRSPGAGAVFLRQAQQVRRTNISV
jgi:hypothetical protein